MLQVEGIRKSYGGVKALKGAGFSAQDGEVVALLGENGAGKSTLGRILSGVISPDAGSAAIDERPIPLGHLRRSRALGVSTAFQELSGVPDLTVAETLLGDRAPRNVLGHVRRRESRRRARRLLTQLGVDAMHAIDVGLRIGDVGLAERQIIEVARALSEKPRVLILDEATSALPFRESSWVLEQARKAADEGAVVIFISHRMQEVRQLADQFVILRGGAVVATGKPSEMSDDDVIAAMLGRRVERLFPERVHEVGDTVFSAVDLIVGRSAGPVSFELRRGEILGLSGLEGQGQGGVMLGIAGALGASGAMTLDGGRYAPRDPHDAIERGVAYVPQDRQRDGLLGFASIQSNISISSLKRFTRGLAIDLKTERKLVREQAERLRIPIRRLGEPVTVLSGGNQQKVILSRILLTDPQVLLLHDCTRGVDVGTKAEIFELVEDMAAQGVAVIFHSSDLSEVVNFCDRVMVMREGEIAAVLERDAVSEDSILRVGVGDSASGPQRIPSTSNGASDHGH